MGRGVLFTFLDSPHRHQPKQISLQGGTVTTHHGSVLRTCCSSVGRAKDHPSWPQEARRHVGPRNNPDDPKEKVGRQTGRQKGD